MSRCARLPPVCDFQSRGGVYRLSAGSGFKKDVCKDIWAVGKLAWAAFWRSSSRSTKDFNFTTLVFLGAVSSVSAKAFPIETQRFKWPKSQFAPLGSNRL